MLYRARTEQNRAELIYFYNENLQQFFNVTIGKTGSVLISAINSSVVHLPRQKLKSKHHLPQQCLGDLFAEIIEQVSVFT